jgi:hypothetical protein
MLGMSKRLSLRILVRVYSWMVCRFSSCRGYVYAMFTLGMAGLSIFPGLLGLRYQICGSLFAFARIRTTVTSFFR